MISLTIKNKEKQKVVLNHRKIEKIEKINDTIIFLENGSTLRVEESIESIKKKIIKFEASIINEANVLNKKGENKDEPTI